MSLNLPYGIQPVNAIADIDVRYGPWISCEQALSATTGTRCVGLTVGIIESSAVVEYWFKTGVTDTDLVIKTMGGTGTLTGATNGIILVNDGTSVALGGTLTGDTIFSDGTLKYADDYSGTYDARTLVDAGFVTGQTANLQSQIDYISGVTDTKLAISVYSAFTATTDNRLSTIEADYITGATNGVCKYSDHDVCLGGTLSSDITFNGGVSEYHLKYAGDYSGTYDARSIPDKGYVDSIASGLDPKLAAMVATTGNITLDSGTTLIDGVSLVDGWRVLVKNQISGNTNGIYVYSAGTWTRSEDFDFTPSGEIVQGALVPIISGDTNRNSIWVLTTEDPIVSGDTLTFTLFSSPIVNAGHGITVSGMTISVDGAALDGNSILWSGGTFNVDINSGTLQTALQNIDNDINYLSGVTSGNTEDIQTNFDLFTGFTASTQPIIDAALTGVTSVGSGTTIYSGITGQTLVLNNIIGSGATTVSKIDNTVVIYSSGGTGVEVFTDDILVSIAAGKTFGKYENGDTIPASGKTPAEVIMMALVEALEPTVSLTNLGTGDVSFGLSAKTVNLSYSHTINSLGATVQSAKIEYNRGLGWFVIFSGTSSGGTYTHNIDDSANRFNTTSIQYKYTVVDTAGGSGVTTPITVTMQPYAAPFISLSLNGTITSPETQTVREKGNVISSPSGSITSQRSLVDITAWTLERRYNGGSWTILDSNSGLEQLLVTISSTLDNTVPTSATSIDYRIGYTDEYTSNYGSTSQITFKYFSYWGFNTNTTVTESEIEAFTYKNFLASDNMTWNDVNSPVGNYTYYAYPSTYPDFTSVIKNGVNQDFGSWQQLSQVNVTNSYGEALNYKVWRTNATQAYSSTDDIVIS